MLRWSETKKYMKISISDNIFLFYLIIIKLCTFKQLENIHQKLKLIFSLTLVVSMATFQQKMTKKGLKAIYLESLMKEYK